MAFEGVDGREAADRLRGRPLYAALLDDPDELWVHELVGSAVVTVGGDAVGTCVSVVANPAADLLELDSGAVPIVFSSTAPRAGSRSTRPRAFGLPAVLAAGRAYRRLHDLPDMVEQFADQSLLGKACRSGALDVRTHDPRSCATDLHRSVDDSPSAAAPGMVLMPEPIFAAVESRLRPARCTTSAWPGGGSTRVSPASWPASTGSACCAVGTRASTSGCASTSATASSIGDVVLAGGEVAAMVVLEAVGRLVPGVMGNMASAEDESFSAGLLEYPHYTRPAELWVGGCPRCCAVATTARWRAGVTLRPWLAPCACVPT